MLNGIIIDIDDNKMDWMVYFKRDESKFNHK